MSMNFYKPEWTKSTIILSIVNWFSYMLYLSGEHSIETWSFKISATLCVLVVISFMYKYICGIIKKKDVNHISFALELTALVILDISILLLPYPLTMWRILCIVNLILFFVGFVYAVKKRNVKPYRILEVREGYSVWMYLFNLFVIGVIYFAQ